MAAIAVGAMVGTLARTDLAIGVVNVKAGEVLRVAITSGRVIITLQGVRLTAERVALLLGSSVGLEQPEAMDSQSVSGSCSGVLAGSWGTGEGRAVGLETGLVAGAGRLQAGAPQ